MEQRFRVVAVNPNLWNPRSPDDHSQGLEYAMPTLPTSQQMRSDRCGWLMWMVVTCSSCFGKELGDVGGTSLNRDLRSYPPGFLCISLWIATNTHRENLMTFFISDYYQNRDPYLLGCIAKQKIQGCHTNHQKSIEHWTLDRGIALGVMTGPVVGGLICHQGFTSACRFWAATQKRGGELWLNGCCWLLLFICWLIEIYCIACLHWLLAMMD